jgi:hypothetical protein
VCIFSVLVPCTKKNLATLPPDRSPELIDVTLITNTFQDSCLFFLLLLTTLQKNLSPGDACKELPRGLVEKHEK